MRLVMGLILALLLFSSLHSNAEQYELQEILKLAEQNNKQIRLARADLKTASAEKLEAFSRALPKIDVNGGYNRNLQEDLFFFEVTDPITGESQTSSFKTSFFNQFRVDAILTQTLFSFEVGYAIQAARYFNRLTENNYETVRQQVFTQIKTAFYQVLLLEKVYQVAQDSENSARENYENLKAKYESGIISEYELLQAEVRWQNAIPQTLNAHKNYLLALNNLKTEVGLPLDDRVELVGNFGYYPEVPQQEPVERVLENRPDYRALIWEKKLYQKNVAAQKAAYFPSLEGSFRYSYSASSDEFKLDQESDNFVIGLSLNVPIFSGSTPARVRRAGADVDRASTRIAQANDNIRVQINNLYLRMKEARQRIDAAAKGIQSAQRAFEIAETRVEHGLATQVELKDSRVGLDQARVNYYSAIFDYLRAYFEWEQTIGKVNIAGL